MRASGVFALTGPLGFLVCLLWVIGVFVWDWLFIAVFSTRTLPAMPLVWVLPLFMMDLVAVALVLGRQMQEAIAEEFLSRYLPVITTRWTAMLQRQQARAAQQTIWDRDWEGRRPGTDQQLEALASWNPSALGKRTGAPRRIER
jgi:hypothetical protein